MPPHPIIELHHIEVVTSKPVAAGSDIALPRCEVGKETIARGIRPPCQHIKCATALGYQFVSASVEGGIQPIASEAIRRWLYAEGGGAVTTRSNSYRLLKPHYRAIEMSNGKHQATREIGILLVSHRYGDVGSFAGTICRLVAADIFNRGHSQSCSGNG